MDEDQKIEIASVPTWLRILNILTLFPILVWPFLFFQVDDFLDSDIKYKWIILTLEIIYPLILIGNVFLTNKLCKNGYQNAAITISIALAILILYPFCLIFF
ncbi:hypothetical protein KIH23_10055 [Flavobacterium sp. CYK-55]|uniref:hypothetical protein n=1 Tax=Flavobacterium sp. CYK-55 TaxID=2835529 RepID=UPI001BD19C39|nr:hypothetical protein [Flavobacterium sp. CYK-55]MBS7787640.1 hypothetical protein [Flavobacterium sp. CYK-55]